MSVAETVNSVASLIRAIVASVLIAVIGYGGGWLYTHFSPNLQLQQKEHELQQVRSSFQAAQAQLQQQHQQLAQLGTALDASRKRITQLDTSLRLMKVDRRLAEIQVLNQFTDPTTGQLVTDFQFQEIDRAGHPLDQPRRFQIQGDLLYVDFWVVKFQDAYIEQGESDRSSSICLFRRLFGEYQEPYEGYVLDAEGTQPAAYRGDQPMSEFERAIWADFWDLAHDPARAAQRGVRAAHGEAVATRLRPGRQYRITLRASDGLTIRPLAAMAEVANQPTPPAG